ncbi:hypothetical protein SLS56_005471 [Neofusicoccum ribis]|uniref:PNPLA domain-containing protein n=1 Tax=Neofusicoccum ribis TaxID=45134 RepID=A0ABR3STG5_9PEZI
MQPLKLELIRRIRGLKLFAESHDQGFCDDESAGNWTWLELAILENESATAPKTTENGVELTWTSHSNELCCADYKWLQGEVFDESRDFLSLLDEGNVIAVRICAQFAAWEIYVRNGYLAIDIGDEIVKRKSVHYDQIVPKINRIDETLRQVNEITQPAFQCSLPIGFYTAGVIEKGGDKPPLRVLSFDGGGVRGLSSLLLLKAVMDKVHPNKKPCEVFDMIGGTSTGGLIAIMLGRLRMSVEECIEKYNKEDLMGKVFNHGWIKKGLNFVSGSQLYSAADLEASIKELLKHKGLGDDKTLLNEDAVDEDETHPCKVFVMAVRRDAANNRVPVFLRSYSNPLDKSLLPGVKIWEAARATSAAPYYFEPIKVGDYELVDGGLGANNPLGWLWTEVLGVFGASRETACFLSIGTGIPPNSPVPKATSAPTVGTVGDFASIATNSEITHVLFHGLIDAFAPKPVTRKYWRLNVGSYGDWEEEKGVLFMKWKKLHKDDPKPIGDMDDIDALEALKDMTNAYIKENDILIGECAKELGGLV